MTPKQRVESALAFREVDLVPYWIQMDPELESRLDEYHGSACWREQIVNHVVGGHAGHRTEPIEDGRYLDAFGSILSQGNILHVEKPALPEPTLEGYRWPDPELLIDWDELIAFHGGAPDCFHLAGLAMGLFERGWIMRGMENLLTDLLLEESFVEELLDGILDVHLRAMDLIADRVPIDAYFGGDDWCGQRSVLMGPGLWRKYFKPRLARMIEHCHDLGLPYVLHSCGNVAPLVDDLMDIGLDGLESLQPEAMDVYDLKGKTEGRLVLIGAMGVQGIIPFGTPTEVHRETQRLIRELGRGGGYVLAPSKPLPAGTPPANAIAFLETACQAGRWSRGA